MRHFSEPSYSLELLFERLLKKLEDWYADPSRAVDYYSRSPVRSGPHGESRPALPASKPPIDWSREWRRAASQPEPALRKMEICWAMMYELDPRKPASVQYRDFYDQVRYRVERESTVGQPLTASRTTPGADPSARRHPNRR